MIQHDMLKKIFEKQQELQEHLGTEYNQEFITTMTVAAIDELLEALRETPWKPWKKNQVHNKQRVKEELADALHFFVNLCLANDITAEELFSEYMYKNKENKKRKDEGY